MKPLCGLERASLLAQMAEVLYALVGTVHGVDAPPWKDLSFEGKHAYYREIEQLVAKLKPLPAQSPLFDVIVTVARAEAAKIVGRISPSEPYGVDPRD